ncbi:MAG TPA: PRC-barrel domain-containing protein [Stellaceae bacterium]|nr:PRC-barrel domain-containing protein [Stellaceae bacterium]
MKKTAIAAILATATMLPLAAAPAWAAADIMGTVPPGKTIQNYYKQSVYDPANNKVGSIDDVVIGDNGQITAFIVGVGGFLGAGTKDVAVPFNAVHAEMKNGAWYLTIDTTKDALKQAHGFTYDKDKTAWVPETKS